MPTAGRLQAFLSRRVGPHYKASLGSADTRREQAPRFLGFDHVSTNRSDEYPTKHAIPP
jgi:hypothetical protein